MTLTGFCFIKQLQGLLEIPTISLGQFLGHNYYVLMILYAPMAFSNVKGHKGLLRAAISESFIIMATLEFFHTINIIRTYNLSRDRRLFCIIKSILLVFLIINEIITFFPTAVKNWDKYELERSGKLTHSALAQSIGAISVVGFIWKQVFTLLRFK
jgi:hypothetical protein